VSFCLTIKEEKHMKKKKVVEAQREKGGQRGAEEKIKP
jgi:hypothetical protein